MYLTELLNLQSVTSPGCIIASNTIYDDKSSILVFHDIKVSARVLKDEVKTHQIVVRASTHTNKGVFPNGPIYLLRPIE